MPVHARDRGGFSVLEMLVALAVCALVLGLLARVAVSEQEVLGALTDRTSGRQEEQVIAGAVAADLRALGDPADIRAGEARDTAVEFRQTIGTAVVCDSTGGLATMVPQGGVPTLASYLRQPEAGDTAWLLDSTRTWIAMRITRVANAPGGPCGQGGPVLAQDALLQDRLALRLAAGAPAPGTPVRITRPFRYSFYRSSDHAWYLGARDWNTTSARLNTVQPVGGPFLAPSPHGTGFQYFDAHGAALATPVAEPNAIAAVRLTLLAPSRRKAAPHASGPSIDSVSVVMRIHGGAP